MPAMIERPPVMRRLPHEPKHENHPRSGRLLEEMGLDSRATAEQKYKADPRGFHSRLVYQGYWCMAAQLKTDYEAGRL